MDNDTALRIVTILMVVIGVFTIPRVIVNIGVLIFKSKTKEPK